MTPETITLDVQLEFRDYLRMSYWVIFHKHKLLLLIIFIGAIVYPLILVQHISQDTPVDYRAGYFIPWALLALLFGGTYFSARKQFASNKSLHEKIRYVFSESGIDVTAAASSGHTAWTHIYEARETGSNFLLYLSKNIMYIVPKRCFRDAEQIASFKQLVRSQLAAQAKLKS